MFNYAGKLVLLVAFLFIFAAGLFLFVAVGNVFAGVSRLYWRVVLFLGCGFFVLVLWRLLAAFGLVGLSGARMANHEIEIYGGNP